MTISKGKKNKYDLIVKISLIGIIILLLIHNCVLLKEKDNYYNSPVPNGNVDIVEINCNKGECKPIPTSKPSGNQTTEITSITFAQKNIFIKQGNFLKLIPIIKPSSIASSKITWKSSDTNIVSVSSDGVIKGLSEGTVTITAISSNGKKASCTVTVTKNSIPVEKIILNPSSMQLKVGDIDQIALIIEPENATLREIVWTTSDAKVATVDNGVVKALKPGTVEITAKTKDGKVKKSIIVVVNQIPVGEIVLNPTSMSLKVDSSSQITAIVKPENATDKKITWTTSDSSIATVDATGKVKGIKPGTVEITAKSSDGKIVAKCSVTVTSNLISVEEIILNPNNLTIKERETGQITATIKPENATLREIVWTTSDSSIATVDATGKVKGIKPGTVKITAKTKDGKVTSSITVVVESILVDDEVNVYDEEKNPVTWNGSNDLKIFTKSIYTMNGVIAPENSNTYQFVVRNNTDYKIKYNVKFIETNPFDINMQFKLKKNDTYIINEYRRAINLMVSEYTLIPNENDTYYLDWKWVSSNNDTNIGMNPEAKYGLKIEVEAESVNE